MKATRTVLVLAIVLGALIVSGCGISTPKPTDVPAPTETPLPAPTPTGVGDEAPTEAPDPEAARDEVLVHVTENYGEQAPRRGLTWMEEEATPEGLVGSATFRYTADDWVVIVTSPVVAPESIIFQVGLTNQATGFKWEGEVDSEGRVTEHSAEIPPVSPAEIAEVAEEALDTDIADWLTYTNERHGYSLKVPGDCLIGPMPGYCKEQPPEERPPECLCFLDGENPDEAFLQAFTGEKDNLGLATFAVSHFDSPQYNPPPATDLVEWIRAEFSWFEDIPDEPNFEIDGTSALRLYVPGGPGASSMDTIYFFKDDKLFQVLMIEVDEEHNRELYDKILSTMDLTAAIPTGGAPAVCWYGRVDSTPADAAIDDYLVLLPEEAKRAVDVVGADATIESEILALRDTGTYAHLWGTLNCDVPGWGGCQVVVDRLRPEGPEGPFFGPDPVEGWTGSLFGTPGDAQFDDYFVLSGGVPMRYGIGSADATVAAQLEDLRDAGAIIRLWGQVACPAIDVQGSHIQVDRIEVVMKAPTEEEGYEGWQAYASAKFGYVLRYPGESTVMGTNLDDAVQFAGQEWPVLSVSHHDSEFYHPPAGTDLQEWISDRVQSYDEIDTDVEIAELPTVHLRTGASPEAYGFDEYYFRRDDQLFRIMILHTGGQEDWDLYDKFLRSFTFP